MARAHPGRRSDATRSGSRVIPLYDSAFAIPPQPHPRKEIRIVECTVWAALRSPGLAANVSVNSQGRWVTPTVQYKDVS
ncbi:hypothetical protein VTO73DRAFT_5310 [Trametes versicolor]